MDVFHRKTTIERFLKSKFKQADIIHWDNADQIVYVFKEIKNRKNDKESRLKILFHCDYKYFTDKNINWIKLNLDIFQYNELGIKDPNETDLEADE